MYNLSLHCAQLLHSAVIHVSVSETNDAGETYVIFTVGTVEHRILPGPDRGTLEQFLEQVCVGLSSALHIGQDGLAQTDE